MGYDWLGLDSKMGKGKSVERAALEMGIPLNEAESYAKKKLKNTKLDDLALHKSAEEALEVGLKELIRIAQAGPLEVKEEETTGWGTDSSKTSKTISPTDLKAAESLVKFALDVRKLIGDSPTSKVEAEIRQKDLWDTETDEKSGRVRHGPWELKIVN